MTHELRCINESCPRSSIFVPIEVERDPATGQKFYVRDADVICICGEEMSDE